MVPENMHTALSWELKPIRQLVSPLVGGAVMQ